MVTPPITLSGEVLGVCSGRAGQLQHGRRTVETAFVKTPHSGPVDIGPLGIATDDHVYDDHGGPDMALLVYSADHYPYWSDLGLELPAVGAMAENLTVTGLVETDVHLGDVFTVGSCTVQVAQPRSPCYKLAARFGRKDLPVLLQNSGYTGYLLRVIAPGAIVAGDRMELVERQPHGVTVAEAGRVANVDRNDIEAARRVLAVDALGASVRRKLEARVRANDEVGLDTERLFLDGESSS